MINVLLALMIIGSFLAAIALHEFAHALAASWLGDRTPRDEGRQSLSLRTHIDPIGTLMCVVLAFQPIFATPLGLGWGKPVKPDPWKMRVGANTGVLMVAWAGPLFSLLIGLLSALLVRFLPLSIYTNPITVRLPQLLIVFASVNICLALFNLIPIYALYGPYIILAIFFLLPFLGRLAGIGTFPLFRLAFYIWLGSVSLIALVVGPFPGSLDFVANLYLL